MTAKPSRSKDIDSMKLGIKRNFAYLCQHCTLLPLPQLGTPRLPLFAQIRELFNLCLVEPVDNGVLSLLNMYALDLDNYQYANTTSIKHTPCADP
jgi:hypothetical protein